MNTPKYEIPMIDYTKLPGYQFNQNSPRFIDRLRISAKVIAKCGIVGLRTIYFGGAKQMFMQTNQGKNEVIDNGLSITSLEPTKLKELQSEIDEEIMKLRARRASLSKRSFSDNQLKISGRRFDAIRSILLESAEVQRLLQQTAPWFKSKHPADIARITLQINDHADIHIHSDVEAGSPTDYMHIDAAIGQLKFILYLSNVQEENGPTCYVPGTNRPHGLSIKRLIAAAVDNCGLSDQSEYSKKRFILLPSWLRFKATFGNDLRPSDHDYEFLLSKEKKICGSSGTIFLFDPSGVHRGGLLRSGERIILQIQLRKKR